MSAPMECVDTTLGGAVYSPTSVNHAIVAALYQGQLHQALAGLKALAEATPVGTSMRELLEQQLAELISLTALQETQRLNLLAALSRRRAI